MHQLKVLSLIAFFILSFPPPYAWGAERRTPVIVFRNIHLVPMTRETILENQAVVIRGNRIAALGPSQHISLPENAKVIHGRGAFLMPGLSDMHIHTNLNWRNTHVWKTCPLYLYLANGVTTIRCFGPRGGDKKYALGWKTKIRKGLWPGPRVYAGGPILFGPVKNPRKTVLDQVSAGFDFIKLYSYLSKQEFDEIMETARQANIYTAGHIPFQVGLKEVISQGLDEIAHIEELAWELFLFDKNKPIRGQGWLSHVKKMAYKQYRVLYSSLTDKALEDLFKPRMLQMANSIKASGIPVCTTLFLDEIILEKLFEPEKFLSRPENRYLPGQYIQGFKKGKEKHLAMFKGGRDFAGFKHKIDLLLLNCLKKRGVRLILGTDSGSGRMGLAPGFSLHDELRILTENGFSPYEAIKTGTVNAAMAAEQMNGSGDFGTIEIGKRADLILVEKNPLLDVGHINKIIGVMASGRYWDKTSLNRLVQHPRTLEEPGAYPP